MILTRLVLRSGETLEAPEAARVLRETASGQGVELLHVDGSGRPTGGRSFWPWELVDRVERVSYRPPPPPGPPVPKEPVQLGMFGA